MSIKNFAFMLGVTAVFGLVQNADCMIPRTDSTAYPMTTSSVVLPGDSNTQIEKQQTTATEKPGISRTDSQTPNAQGNCNRNFGISRTDSRTPNAHFSISRTNSTVRGPNSKKYQRTPSRVVSFNDCIVLTETQPTATSASPKK